MKKIILVLALMCPMATMADTVNPFIYTSGKLSLGVVGADMLSGYDIFKHVDGVTARVGGSVTVAQYDVFGAYVGALAPSANANAVALVAGPSVSLDSVSKASISALLQVLPFKIDSTTADKIGSATTLKLYAGYDFFYKEIIGGAAFGVKIF